jgi:hypothetical protein
MQNNQHRPARPKIPRPNHPPVTSADPHPSTTKKNNSVGESTTKSGQMITCSNLIRTGKVFLSPRYAFVSTGSRTSSWKIMVRPRDAPQPRRRRSKDQNIWPKVVSYHDCGLASINARRRQLLFSPISFRQKSKDLEKEKGCLL